MLPTLPPATSKVVAGALAATGVAVDASTSDVDHLIWRALAVILAAHCGREADRRTLALAAAAAAITVTTAPISMVMTTIATAAAIALIALPARPEPTWRHPLGALTAGAATLALLHQSARLSPWWSLLLALIGLAPVFVSGVRRQSSRRRRRTQRVLLAGGAALVLVGGVAAIAVLQSRSGLNLAVQATEAGLASARAGDVDDATAQLAQAQAAFGRARQRVDGPLTAPARLLPIVGDNLDAVATASQVGEDLTGAAIDLAEQADYRSLRLVDGALELDDVTAMQEPVGDARAATADALATTQAIDRTWLVSPVSQRLDRLEVKADDALGDLATASDVLAITPALLGEERPTHWYVMFTQPAEARNGGGFVPNFAILRADNGKLEVIEDDETQLLEEYPGERTVTLPDWYRSTYGRYDPARLFRNHTASADGPTNAAIAAEVVPQTGRPPIDGVITIDPTGIAALLELSGPVRVDGLDEPLTADNAEAYLLAGQYEDFQAPGSRDDRKDALDEAGKAAFEALLDGESPSPNELARVLGPAVAGGHLSIVPLDEQPLEVFDRLGLTGRFTPPAEGDWVSVRHASAAASKLDTYLKRHLDYRATVGPDGALSANATVRVTNTAPEDLPSYVTIGVAELTDGSNRTMVTLLSPHQLDEVRVDGEVIRVLEGNDTEHANAYLVPVDVPRGETVTIEFDLTGTLAGNDPSVTVLPQPAALDLTADVHLDSPWGQVSGDGTVAERRRFTP